MGGDAAGVGGGEGEAKAMRRVQLAEAFDGALGGVTE